MNKSPDAMHVRIIKPFLSHIGDTLYSTTGELIDWYVGGSSVIQMLQSVRRLSEILESKKVSILHSKFLKLKICQHCVMNF